MKLTVATCQFPVSADIGQNTRHVLRQIEQAKQQGAQVAHFCESALSGYPGFDFKTFQGFDWKELRECSQSILEQARKFRIWVLLGSSHPLTRRHKPHNSVYVINASGKIVDRYDKMFCAGRLNDKKAEIAHFSPGSHFCVFTIKGIRCGVAICHEYRYPELYRQYKQRGVQLMFHSFYTGNVDPRRFRAMQDQVGQKFHKLNRGTTLPEITMPAAMQAACASNHIWISCSNTSARESCWPATFVRPDGVITGRLRKNVAGVLISTVDTNQNFYDSTAPWRDRAMQGKYHSGKLVTSERTENRTEL